MLSLQDKIIETPEKISEAFIFTLKDISNIFLGTVHKTVFWGPKVIKSH